MWIDELVAADACEDGVQWARTMTGVGRQRAWESCPYPHWAMWCIVRVSGVIITSRHRRIMTCLCDVINHVMKHENSAMRPYTKLKLRYMVRLCRKYCRKEMLWYHLILAVPKSHRSTWLAQFIFDGSRDSKKAAVTVCNLVVWLLTDYLGQHHTQPFGTGKLLMPRPIASAPDSYNRLVRKVSNVILKHFPVAPVLPESLRRK